MPGTSWMQSAGRPALAAASDSTDTSARLDWIAVAEPRSSAQLPDLIASPAASTVTFGRASYTIASTPNGTRTWLICRPLGWTKPRTTSPTGSGSAAISRKPVGHRRHPVASSVSRSMSCSASPVRPSGGSTSSALAASTSVRGGLQRVGHRQQRRVLDLPGQRRQFHRGRLGPAGHREHLLFGGGLVVIRTRIVSQLRG